jgi:hypothetical protein
MRRGIGWIGATAAGLALSATPGAAQEVHEIRMVAEG